MKIRAKHLIVILLATLMVTASFVIASQAKQASKGKKGVQTLGWCCKDSKIVKSTPLACTKKKGHFFTNNKAAKTYCDAQTPGWCCLDGKVTASKKGNCLKNKGKFFKDKKAASKICEPMGWCLLNSRIFETTRKKCQMRRGRFFTQKGEAQKAVRLAKQGKKTSRAPAATGKTTPLAQAAPLLSVDKIYLKGGTVRLHIRNRSREKLTRDKYTKGRLVLKLDEKGKSWPLSKIDPKGALNRGKSVDFDTGVRIARRTRIQVTLSHLPGKKKTVLLSPPAGKSLKPAKILGKELKGLNKSPSAMMTMRSKIKLPAGTGHHVVPFMLDRGIAIVTPASGDVVHRGQTLHIQYRYTHEGAAGGEIVFSLLRRSNNTELATITQDNGSPGITEGDGLHEIDFPIPSRNTLQYADDYIIRADHSGSGAFGISDMFAIRPIDMLTIQTIGEGGAFGGIGKPCINLLSPKGEHFHFTTGSVTVRWRYHGPLEDCPHTWHIEFTLPGQSTPAFTRTSYCMDHTDEPAADAYSYPTRTCEEIFEIDSGSYNLKISGGSLTDETDHPFHVGCDREWPNIQVFNPTPRAGGWLFKGDPITVHWSVSPPDATVFIKIEKDGRTLLFDGESGAPGFSGCEPVADGDTFRTCQKTYSMPADFEPGTDYKIVIGSGFFRTRARVESGPFRILEPPLESHTQPDAVDFIIGNRLHVREDGHLEVVVWVQPGTESSPPDSYTLPFLVGHNFSGEATPGGTRVERSVPSSSGSHLIDLGHINRFITAAERRSYEFANFTVRVNLPPVVEERDYENNLQTNDCPIRHTSVGLTLTSADIIYFNSLSPDLGNLTPCRMWFINHGYAPATGRIQVIQYARDVPGELYDGSEERIVLGSREITLAPTRRGYQLVSIFGHGVSLPQGRNGEIEVIFYGNLGVYQDTVRIPFQYRRP